MQNFNEYGMTAPYLKLARRYGVDYGAVLIIVHTRQYGIIPGGRAAMDHIGDRLGNTMSQFFLDMERIMKEFNNLRRGHG